MLCFMIPHPLNSFAIPISAQSATMADCCVPYRQVFLTWTRPRIVYCPGISARPSRMMPGQPSADEGGCYVEEGKEEVPEKEEGEEEVPEEEEGREEVPEAEGEAEVRKEEPLEEVPAPE